MAKKLDNKKLLGVLVILALIFFVTEYLRDNERGNVELPTRVIGLGGDSSVTEFTIYPEGEKGEILFSKDADSWYVEANGLKGEAEKTSVESMIDQIMAAKPSRLVAKTKEKWEKYLLTDSLASRISFKRGEEVIIFMSESLATAKNLVMLKEDSRILRSLLMCAFMGEMKFMLLMKAFGLRIKT